MRLSSQEEYGLRCLLVVARLAPVGCPDPVAIDRIASAEGIGYEHAAKILRLLRRGGLVDSTRGVNGGYRLARNPNAIGVWDVLVAMDPPLVHKGFCDAFAGKLEACRHSGSSCSLKALWCHVGQLLEGGLRQLTLADLIAGRVPGGPQKEIA